MKEIAIFPKQVCHAEIETKSQNYSFFKYWRWRITASEVLEKVSDDEIVRKPEKNVVTAKGKLILNKMKKSCRICSNWKWLCHKPNIFFYCSKSWWHREMQMSLPWFVRNQMHLDLSWFDVWEYSQQKDNCLEQFDGKISKFGLKLYRTVKSF